MSLSGTKKSIEPSSSENVPVPPEQTVESESAECPPIKYVLKELVEVVDQDQEKWVKGAAGELVNTDIITQSVERGDTNEDDASLFKQYINQNPNCEEDATKIHPEYGRLIKFRARIEREDSETEDLAGVKVVFNFGVKKGPGRSNPDDDVWEDAELSEAQKGKLEGQNEEGKLEVSSTDTGWTPPVTFVMSRYAGDQFHIGAQLHEDVTTSRRMPPKYTKYYEVWRKFWYQKTFAKDFAAIQPTAAEDEYKAVFAEMIQTPDQEFEEADLPVNLRGRTFLEEYQVKRNCNNADKVAVIGSHNKDKFTADPFYNADDPQSTPLKANLIICEYQCDAAVDDDGNHVYTKYGRHKLTANGGVITPVKGNGGPIACSPPLRTDTDAILKKGEWGRMVPKTGGELKYKKGGSLTNDCFEVYANRPSTLSVKVDLSNGATAITGDVPVPTAENPLWVKLKLETAEEFLGESFGTGQILCVYKPNASNDSPTEGNQQDFNNTVAHEIGHMWNQTPELGDKKDSLNDHPLLYAGHGGDGPHCRHNAEELLDDNNDTVSRDAQTTITRRKRIAGKTHTVASSDGFIADHIVTVNGRERTIREIISATKIKFTRAFTASPDQPVVQKIADYSPVNWTDDDADKPKPSNGDCIMFHEFSDQCSNEFCDICKVHLQLQEMEDLSTG